MTQPQLRYEQLKAAVSGDAAAIRIVIMLEPMGHLVRRGRGPSECAN